MDVKNLQVWAEVIDEEGKSTLVGIHVRTQDVTTETIECLKEEATKMFREAGFSDAPGG